MNSIVVVCSLILYINVLGISPKKSSPMKRPNDKPFIIGGYAVAIEDVPYQAAYERMGILECGASVISHSYALSAAHCSERDVPAIITIRVGTAMRAQGGTVHQAVLILNHPSFSMSPQIDFDVSLVKVSEPFVYSDQVRPIPLTRREPASGSRLLVSGWGVTASGHTSRQLLQVAVTAVDRAVCRRAYRGRITRTMLCGGAARGGRDSCQGDSGGPLAHRGVLVGVVSWGHGCARPGVPGVYANLAALRGWIEDSMAAN